MVWNRIQCNLAAVKSGQVAPQFCRERVRCFMTADDSRWASFDFDYFQSPFVISTIASALGTEIDLDVVDTSGSGPY